MDELSRYPGGVTDLRREQLGLEHTALSIRVLVTLGVMVGEVVGGDGW